MQNFKTQFKKLLTKNKKFEIRILFSGLEALDQNCEAYYGAGSGIKWQEDATDKLRIIVRSILGDNDLRSAFIEERICIRTTNVVFTTSFVAHDLFSRRAENGKKNEAERPVYSINKPFSQIKATFYQYGESNTETQPSICYNSDKNARDMFPYFGRLIFRQWDSATEIKGVEELEKFSHNLSKKLAELEQNTINPVKG